MRPSQGNDLDIGGIVEGNAHLGFSAKDRGQHLYVCGATGTGKSKFLEHLIRQDILNWRKIKCGLILIDPHGSLYDHLMSWLAWVKPNRPIIPIDLRKDDWVIGYKVLRQREKTDPAVLVSKFVQAMAYVWGASGTDETPRFERWAGNVLRTLYENKLTLLEAERLLTHAAREFRETVSLKLEPGKGAAVDWQFLNKLNPKDFEGVVESTVNRLRRFVETQALRQMFGQDTVYLIST